MIRSVAAVAVAATLAIPLSVPASAQRGLDEHYDHGRRDDRRGPYDHDRDRHGGNGGAVVGGALLGLGVGALIGGAMASSQPAYRPPPPVYYAPTPPGYYAPPPPVTSGY